MDRRKGQEGSRVGERVARFRRRWSNGSADRPIFKFARYPFALVECRPLCRRVALRASDDASERVSLATKRRNVTTNSRKFGQTANSNLRSRRVVCCLMKASCSNAVDAFRRIRPDQLAISLPGWRSNDDALSLSLSRSFGVRSVTNRAHRVTMANRFFQTPLYRAMKLD